MHSPAYHACTPLSRYVRYFLSRIEMLRSHGVVPIVIFDGCRLPMKADEEDTRRRYREALHHAVQSSPLLRA